MREVKLTGHHYPRPLTVCIVKESKRCPNCGADREHGFEVLIETSNAASQIHLTSTDKTADGIEIDETLTFGIACLCWICGFRF